MCLPLGRRAAQDNTVQESDMIFEMVLARREIEDTTARSGKLLLRLVDPCIPVFAVADNRRNVDDVGPF